jgi:RNA polymerase sigma-70 factor (ECF subfamily)
MSRVMPSSPDDVLMREIAHAGDAPARERAFRELVSRHGEALHGFVRCHLARPHEVDDVVQESFLRVYLARERYTAGEASFRTWLFRIARNLALDLRRRENVRRARPLEDEAVVATEPTPGPLDILTGAEAAAHVREAIEKLPALDREAIVLRFHEDLDYPAIAVVIGGGAVAAKQRVWRAMCRLRKSLDEGES